MNKSTVLLLAVLLVPTYAFADRDEVDALRDIAAAIRGAAEDQMTVETMKAAAGQKKDACTYALVDDGKGGSSTVVLAKQTVRIYVQVCNGKVVP